MVDLSPFRDLFGFQIPAGCDSCDAYQTVDEPQPDVFVITVHHDDWCWTHGVLW